jgi:hypothetical protein
MNRRNFIRAVKLEIIKRATRPDRQPACERCGAVGLKMDVHHKVMDAMQIDKSRKLTAEDGELLCEPCHDPITATQRRHLAKALAREAKHVGATRPASKIKSAGFKPVSRAHVGREPSNGMSEIQRRFAR